MMNVTGNRGPRRTRGAAPRGVRAPRATTSATVPLRKAPLPPQPGRDEFGCRDGTDLDKVDVAVVGSGVGGLCAAALLARTGRSVAVLEAHSAPGGAAHHWERRGFKFDSGAALFSGLLPDAAGKVSANPLCSVLEAIEERLDVVELPDDATCLIYPDGKQYRTQIASDRFVDVVRDRLGPEAASEWQGFQRDVTDNFGSAGAVQPMAVRLDNQVARTTAFRRPLDLLRYLLGSRKLIGKSFQEVVDRSVARPEVQALVDMITEGTCSAAPREIDASYMVRAFAETWSPRTRLQYPKGGSQAIVEALLRGIGKCDGHLLLRSRVRRVVERTPGVAAAIELESGRTIGVNEAVVSNASVWDTARLLCPESAARAAPAGETFADYHEQLEMNDSMLHLHVGFRRKEGEDLPMHTYFLESPLTGSNGWPTIVVPSVPDPSLAPEGCHVLHATMTEPYAPWAALPRGGPEYERLKAERGDVLMGLVRQLIPDIDERVVMTFIGTPLSHERFLFRRKGTYGPKNLLTMSGALPQAVKPLENMLCCGDSVFPGVGTPAVSASGMWVANTLMSVSQQSAILDDLGI